jgi:hypothetical protein
LRAVSTGPKTRFFSTALFFLIAEDRADLAMVIEVCGVCTVSGRRVAGGCKRYS